jgi:ribosomal 30S subunit maturation factor RimM
LFEYIGCDVFENDDKKGVVDRVEEYNSRQWLIVLDNNKKEVMIPMQGGFLEQFDVKARKIVINSDTGLFETHAEDPEANESNEET